MPPFQPWHADFGAYGWLAHATTSTTRTGEDAATALPCPRQEEARDGGWDRNGRKINETVGCCQSTSCDRLSCDKVQCWTKLPRSVTNLLTRLLPSSPARCLFGGIELPFCWGWFSTGIDNWQFFLGADVAIPVLVWRKGAFPLHKSSIHPLRCLCTCVPWRNCLKNPPSNNVRSPFCDHCFTFNEGVDAMVLLDLKGKFHRNTTVNAGLFNRFLWLSPGMCIISAPFKIAMQKPTWTAPWPSKRWSKGARISPERIDAWFQMNIRFVGPIHNNLATGMAKQIAKLVCN